jgi:hypothetical protein
MVNSDDQFRRIQMSESDDTEYPIGRGEVIPDPAVQQSIELCTGRYDKPKANRKAVSTDAHREVKREVDLEVCQADQDSAEDA